MKIKFNKTWLGCEEWNHHATTFEADTVYEIDNGISNVLATVAVSVGAGSYVKEEPVKKPFFKKIIENKLIEPTEDKDGLNGFVESLSTQPPNKTKPVTKKRRSRKKVK